MYSLDDLEKAKVELQKWDDSFANDSSNNPNKHESQRKSARAKVRLITEALKTSGLIKLSTKEQTEKELDAAFPNARSNEIVDLNGVKYQRKFFPLEKSRSRKSVTVWGKTWEKLSDC